MGPCDGRGSRVRNPFARKGRDEDLDLSGAHQVTFTEEPDATLWLIGPTEGRPADVWLPGATEILVESFGIDDQARSHELVSRMLTAVLDHAEHGLPYVWLRWPALDVTPVGLWFGMVQREGPEELEGFLTGADGDAVEPPVVETLEDSPEVTLRRGQMYRNAGSDELIGTVRYVVDQGHPEQLVVATAATWELGLFPQLVEDCDALMRTVRMTGRTR